MNCCQLRKKTLRSRLSIMSSLLISLFSVLLLLAGTFYIAIPQSVCLYQGWKQTKKPTTFSTLIITLILSFFLLSIAFKMSMNLALDYTSKAMFQFSGTWALEIASVLSIFLLVSFNHAFFIPKLLQFFNKWRATNKPTYFSLMIFFGAVTFFCFSFIYLAVFKLG